MTAATPSKTDLMYEIVYSPKFVPLRSSKVNVKTTVVKSKASHLMKNHATGTYYDLDEVTNLIWELVDGKRTVKQIIKEVQRQEPHVREQKILEILLFFADADLLKSSFEQTPKKRFKVVSPFEIDFTIIRNSNKFFQILHKKIHSIFKRPLLWVAIAFIIAGAVLFAGEFVSIYGKKANFEILGSSVVGFFFYYFVALAPIIAVHEIAHAITLVHYNGQAGEVGTGLFYFGPMFYTETTDAWGFSRRDRMMVYLAGNISTLLIGASLVIVHLTLSIPEPGSHILVMVAFYCFTMSLFNFAPPFETDGYYILSDIVNMPNLRRDSYAYLGSVIRKALGRNTKAKISGLTARKKRIFVGYAILSVTWIAYIVFQSSLFLVYMGEDVVSAVGNIVQSVLLSQALQMSVVVIAMASVLYFGMQVVGYGFVFSAAVKKMTVVPLTVEAIHDRDLAVFAYLPPSAPDSLSDYLRKKMEKAAKKLTSRYEIKRTGRSCLVVLRMGGTSLAVAQIKEHLKHVEDYFSSAYQNLILKQKDTLERSFGIYAHHKKVLTATLEQIAAHSAEAGNPSAVSIAKCCEKKQTETLTYLLLSTFGTVWTIEVQPAQVYDMQKELIPSLLMQDVTLADLYGNVEDFKRRTIYGFDSLAKLSADIETGLRECLAKPERYQLISFLEPIKGRIVLAGRTEQIEKDIEVFARLFVAHTLSGYLDSLLSEVYFKLSALSKTSLPDSRKIKEMSTGEVAVLYDDLSAFSESKKSVDDSIQDSEDNIAKVRKDLTQVKHSLADVETFKTGIMDDIINVNVENLNILPSRIKEFRKEWKELCERLEKVKDQVKREHDKRKLTNAKRVRETLRIYPFLLALSIALLALGSLPSWGTLWIAFPLTATFSQVLYWFAFYRRWKSLHRVTKYPSQAFTTAHVLTLAVTEAVYGYVATADVVSPV